MFVAVVTNIFILGWRCSAFVQLQNKAPRRRYGTHFVIEKCRNRSSAKIAVESQRKEDGARREDEEELFGGKAFEKPAGPQRRHFSAAAAGSGAVFSGDGTIHFYSVSSPKAVCSTRTASSAYFSSITQEIRISEVLIMMILMFSLARAANILDATPE